MTFFQRRSKRKTQLTSHLNSSKILLQTVFPSAIFKASKLKIQTCLTVKELNFDGTSHHLICLQTTIRDKLPVHLRRLQDPSRASQKIHEEVLSISQDSLQYHPVYTKFLRPQWCPLIFEHQIIQQSACSMLIGGVSVHIYNVTQQAIYYH